MKTMVFLIWSSTHSITRYLLVANELSKLRIKTIFLDFEGKFKTIIDNNLIESGIQNLPHYASYKKNQTPRIARHWFYMKIKSLLKYIIKKNDKLLFGKADLETKQTSNTKLGKIIKNLGFNNELILKKYNRKISNVFRSKVNLAENFIKEHQPDGVFYDIELVENIRAFLYAANNSNVKIFSMQHAEGNSYSYSNLPLLADYYIAYSKFNYRVLEQMGVKKKNIILTGNPEIDIIFKVKLKDIEIELKKYYDINFTKNIILIPLKPSSYSEQNNFLIEKVLDCFGSDDSYAVVIKPHPTDMINNYKPINENLNKYKNIYLIDSSYPFFKLLKICQYTIFYFSSCIVESILLNKKAIVIDDPYLKDKNGVKWPYWSDYKVFHKIKSKQLSSILTLIKLKKYNNENHLNQHEREKFIKEFLFKYDSDSSKRIAQNVINLI